jgi:hypothetical protein
MAHTGIFATKAQCDAMAGENVDTTGYTETNINSWCLEAESYINILSKKNFSDAYASLNADVKAILQEYEARYVAMCAICYNMSGFTTRTEAENMLNVHIFRMRKIEDLIGDSKFVSYMESA